jgi:hypothetical protein
LSTPIAANACASWKPLTCVGAALPTVTRVRICSSSAGSEADEDEEDAEDEEEAEAEEEEEEEEEAAPFLSDFFLAAADDMSM